MNLPIKTGERIFLHFLIEPRKKCDSQRPTVTRDVTLTVKDNNPETSYRKMKRPK